MSEHRPPSPYFEDISEALDNFIRDNRVSLGDTEHKLYNALLDARREVARLVSKLDDLVPEWGALTVCEECGATIPDGPEDSSIANKHHAESCSLYDEENE